MESRMAGLNHTTSETSDIPYMYYLPTPWQLIVIGAIFIWLIIAQLTAVTKHLRALIQPFVLQHEESGVPLILAIQVSHERLTSWADIRALQKHRHPWLDSFFGVIATVVSTPFYSLVLPLLFWHGQAKLGRQLTLLMATCVYVGNSFKDFVCAPRPPSPVCRVASSESEKRYVLYYLMGQQVELITIVITTAFLTTTASLVIFGRLYLGMHSPIDIVAGCAIGASLLLGWCKIDKYLDAFIVEGKNVVSFWAAIAILGLYAYPTPESPTPSFEDYTAFNGVALGIVSGVHRTFRLYHSGLPSAASLTPAYVGMKTALGMVTIFAAKEGSKYLATIVLPLICYVPEMLVGFRFYSSSYVKSMRKEIQEYDVEAPKLCGVLKPFYRVGGAMDVDTGIRFVQYAALGWAVVELAPRIFSLLVL